MQTAATILYVASGTNAAHCRGAAATPTTRRAFFCWPEDASNTLSVLGAGSMERTDLMLGIASTTGASATPVAA